MENPGNQTPKPKSSAIVLGASLLLLCVAFFTYFFSRTAGRRPPFESYGQQNLPQMVLGASTGQVRGEAAQKKPVKLVLDGAFDLEEISAKSFLVFTGEEGDSLLAKNPESRLGIASLTKLMTAYVAYQVLDLGNEMRIESLPEPAVSPSLGLRQGERVRLLDLFSSMLVGSENDAAYALSRAVEKNSGKSMTALMNESAKALGMANSNFGNPYGFDYNQNYSTAEDLKKLIMQTQKLHAFVSLEKRTEYSFKGELGAYKAKATNRLVGKYPEIYAIKTGYTENALGSIALKTYIFGKPVIVLVIGSQNREKDALALIEAVKQHSQISQ